MPVALMMSNRIEFYPIDVGPQHPRRDVPPSTTRRHPKPSVTSSPIPVHGFLVCETGTWIRSAARAPHTRDDRRRRRAIACPPARHRDPGADEEFCRIGFRFRGAPGVRWTERRRHVDLHLGTTGNPKGVETTHACLLFETNAVSAVLPVEFGDASPRTCRRRTSPIGSPACTCKWCSAPDHCRAGSEPGSGRASGLSPHDLGQRPPCVGKAKSCSRIGCRQRTGRRAASGVEWALDVGLHSSRTNLRAGETVPAELEADYARADTMVLSALRAKLGLPN
ncbi:unnamed protein product, partial [Mesorhabditis spiculigera]